MILILKIEESNFSSSAYYTFYLKGKKLKTVFFYVEVKEDSDQIKRLIKNYIYIYTHDVGEC